MIQIPAFVARNKVAFLAVGGIGAAWLVYRMGERSSSNAGTAGAGAGLTYAGVPIFSGGAGAGLSADNAGSAAPSDLSSQVGKLIDAINAANNATGTAPTTQAAATSTQSGGATAAPMMASTMMAAPSISTQSVATQTTASPARPGSKGAGTGFPTNFLHWAYQGRPASNIALTRPLTGSGPPRETGNSFSSFRSTSERAGANVSGGITGARDVGNMAPGISFGQSVAIGLGVASMGFGGVLGPAIGLAKMAGALGATPKPATPFAGVTRGAVGSLQSSTGGYGGPAITTPGFSITRTTPTTLTQAQIMKNLGVYGYQGDLSSHTVSPAGTSRGFSGGGRGGSSTSGGGYGSEAGAHAAQGIGGAGASNRSA